MKKQGISLLVGGAASAGTLYLALKNVPFTDLLSYLSEIHYGWVLLSAATVLPIFMLRAFRWRIILNCQKKLQFWKAFHPLMIGFMLNCILPGRIGEAVRPFVLKKNENIPFVTGLATVAVERLMDMGFLILLSIFALSTVHIAKDYAVTFGSYHLSPNMLASAGKNLLRLSIVLMAGILFITIPYSRDFLKRLLSTIPEWLTFIAPSKRKRLQGTLIEPVIKLIDLFATGFSFLKNPSEIFWCLSLTLLIWGITAFSYFIMAKGCPNIGLTFSQSIVVMVIICLFIALPSVPGYWGIWEAGGVFSLSLFNIPTQSAAGFTLTNHAVQIFPVILIGIISAMVTSVNIFQLSKAASITNEFGAATDRPIQPKNR
jgi:glycosyltransferase 2 family protein